MSETTIQFNFDVGGVATDVTTCVFSDPTGTYGVRRTDTLAVVVADATPLTHDAVGQYSYTFTDPAAGLTYNYWIEFVYSGNTYRIEREQSGSSAPVASVSPPIENVVTAGCTGAYAYAWEFASFWCSSSILKRLHNGAAASTALTDTLADFVTAGVVANTGMILYNLTDGSSGLITAVTEHTITAPLTGGTDNLWDANDVYRVVLLDATAIATIGQILAIAAGDVHAALAASGACSCTFASWVPNFLKKLNIIEAAAFYLCPCAKPSMPDDMRNNLLTWAERQLELIRTGKLEVCGGATGADYPAIDWAEQGVDEWSRAKIILNDEMRDG